MRCKFGLSGIKSGSEISLVECVEVVAGITCFYEDNLALEKVHVFNGPRNATYFTVATKMLVKSARYEYSC